MSVHPATAAALGVLLLGAVLLPAAHAVDVPVSLSLLNAPPIVAGIALSGTGLSLGTLTPLVNTARTITATVTVTDANTCNDLASVSIGLSRVDGSTGTAVHTAEAADTQDSCTLATTAVYSRQFTLQWYDLAAVNPDKYRVTVTAVDDAGASAINLGVLGDFYLAELNSANVPSSLSLSATPGSAGSASALSITNRGNVPLDLTVLGTDLEDSASSTTMPVGNILYGTTSSPSTALATSAAPVDLNLAPGASSSDDAYFALASVDGFPAGTYEGTITVTTVVSS